MMGRHDRIFTEQKWNKVNPYNKQVVDEFLKEQKAKKRASSTIGQYRNDLKIFLIWIHDNVNNINISEITRKDVRDFTLFLSEELNQSNARTNRMLSTCRSVMNFMADEYQLDNMINIARSIKNLPKERSKNIVFLPNHVVMGMYNYFMEHKRYRDATLLALAYESAGRRQELSQVKKDTVNNQRNNTNIVVGKRGKKFTLLYFELTQRACEKYLEQRGEDNIPNLFITDRKHPASSDQIYSWIKGWRDIVEQLTGRYLELNVHSLRHSSIQNYYDGSHEIISIRKLNKISIEDLKRLAHHESIEITLSYLRQDDDETFLENAFNVFIQHDE